MLMLTVLTDTGGFMFEHIIEVLTYHVTQDEDVFWEMKDVRATS